MQAIGIHRGGCGDLGLRRWHMPSGCENVSLCGVEWDPMMALESYDGVQ